MVVLAVTMSSTTLVLPAAPVSQKYTSLEETGGPLGVQLFAVGQLMFAPAGVQTIAGLNGGAEAIVIVKVVEMGVMLTEFDGLLFA